MGSGGSKQDEEGNFSKMNSFRRSSKGRKSSKLEPVEANLLMVNNLKKEIDIFEGNRSSARYKQFQEILTSASKNVQQAKNKAKKDEQRDRCDQVLGEIQSCFQRLETRLIFIERNDHSLDLAAVESHSFINHSFVQKPQVPESTNYNHKWNQELPQPIKQRPPKFDSIKSFERIEQETQNLERDIRKSIELEDYKQFKILEKKIEILYTDLEMIHVDDHTPLSDRKATIGKKLIKCNNHIKKAKKALESKIVEYSSKQDGPAMSKPARSGSHENDYPVDFVKIESALEELEVQALTFEGIRTDRKYKELEQTLESYWTKVYSADAFGYKETSKREAIIDRIKNILQALGKRAEENEKQSLAIAELRKIELQLQGLKKKSAEFQGGSKDSLYLELDQKLRSLWANITAIEEPNEHVRRSKMKVITEIQDVLRSLSQVSKNAGNIYENGDVRQIDAAQAETPFKGNSPKVKDVSEEDITQLQLLNQVKEFQNHWNQLNYNLDVQSITKSEISQEITDTFERMIDQINKKRSALLIIEKRKSTGSLVVAKVIDNTDMLSTIKVYNVHPNQTPPIVSHESSQTAAPPGDRQGYNVILDIQNSKNYQSHVGYQKYNVTPDLLQKQAVGLPLAKPMEIEIKVQPTVKTIGEMQRVGTEAKSLLHQIRQSSCIKYDDEYSNYYAKLEQCRRTLESIEYNKKSDTLESNRRRAAKTISEGFRILEEKGTKVVDEREKAAAIRSSRAQEVMDIDAEILYFRQQIKNFTGVVKDRQYEKIKYGLSDCLTKLQIMDDMHVNKQDSICHIQQYHQELETKLAENQAKVRVMEQNAIIKRQASQDIRVTVERVQKLKGQVERFSGVYDGLLYKQIEENLRNCNKKMDDIDTKGDERLENAKVQTKDKIKKYLRVLEDKSSKTSTFDDTSDNLNQDQTIEENVKQPVHQEQEQSRLSVKTAEAEPQQQRKSLLMDPNSPHYKINALRDKLIGIKNKTETFAGRYKDSQYRDIEMDMINCLEELKIIDDRGHRSVIISKEQYEDYIAKLMNYFEDKTKIEESEHDAMSTNTETNQTYQMQTFKIIDPTEQLVTAETKITELKKKINIFTGTANSDAYKELLQEITSESTMLQNVQAGNVAHMRELKRKLLQELTNCKELLETKVSGELQMGRPVNIQHQLDKIEDILKEVEETAKEVNVFEGTKDDDNFGILDEVLIKLMIQLDNTETYDDSEVKEARKSAIQFIQRIMKELADRARYYENANVDVAATVV